MTEAIEPAEANPTSTRSSPNLNTYTKQSKLTEVLKSTLWYHKHGRLSRKDAAAKRWYLTPSKEKTVIDYVLGNNDPVLVESVGQLA